MIQKVTIFITRLTSHGVELLLIAHPHAGNQIPAGTVEPGELPLDAAQREAAEETGITAAIDWKCLGRRDEHLPDTERVVVEATPAYSRPDDSSFGWAHLPRGIAVGVERRVGDFTQVCYREHDRLERPRYVSYQITGWVPNAALTQMRRRHFFHAPITGHCPDSWERKADGHRWQLFWAPLANLPAVVSPQDTWLEWLTTVDDSVDHLSDRFPAHAPDGRTD